VEFRAAWPDEHARVQRLFRIPFRFDKRLDLVLAVTSGKRQRILACAALYPLADTSDAGAECRLGWSIRAADADTEYELLRAAAHRAAASGFSSLSHQTYLDPEDPRALTLRAMGFSPRESIDEFQCSYTSVWNRCRRIHERLGADKGPPSEIRITSLERAVLPAVRARLHEERIMDTLDFDDRLRPGHGQPTDREKSTVLLAGDTLIAVMLVAPLADGRGYAVPARWVAPEYRRGWANVVLIYHSTAQGQELGLDYIRFVANSKAHDETVRLSQRLGGHRVTSRHRYALRLTNP
ncbi:MAG TPA: hypothetical protein QF901_07365, partial [Gammaproteobacteria bacterium]|nr:hypothetical protein [Gammaproteobacteria bacterium]